jgi:hypothetical protein
MCDHNLPYFNYGTPAFPTSLAKEWKRPTLISTNKRYYFVALNLEGITSSSMICI